MKNIICFLVSLLSAASVFSQTSPDSSSSIVDNDKPYKIFKLRPAVDIPLTAAGTGWTLYAFSKIYSKDTSSRAQIFALNPNNVAKINRSSTHRYSPKAFDLSNKFFYGSMPFPLILLADKKIRHDYGKVSLMWLEAMAVTGTLYTGAVYVKDKYRPYAYNSNVDINRRVRGGAKNSFFAGHVALVGTSTFFTAKVYADYHPESAFKYVLYGVAIASTGATGYLRYKAGEHFLTDVLIGVGVGTLSGILVPHFHKNKDPRSDRLTIAPMIGTQSKGLSLAYRL